MLFTDNHGSHTATLLVRFTLPTVRFLNTLEVLLQQLEKEELTIHACNMLEMTALALFASDVLLASIRIDDCFFLVRDDFYV